MPVTNVVEAVLGRKQVKWDAWWRLFAWLLDAQEGHALGSKVVDEIVILSARLVFQIIAVFSSGLVAPETHELSHRL